MKKTNTLIIVLLFCGFLISFGQSDIDKGQYLISGSFNLTIQENYLPISSITSGSFFGVYSSSNSNNLKYSSFTISPTVSKVVNDHWNVGFYGSTSSTNLTTSNSGVIGETKRNSIRYTAGIISRYIINPDNEFNVHISPYIGFSVADENYSSTSGSNINDISVQLFEAGLRPGIMYNINEKFRLLMNAGNLSYVNGTSTEANETYKFRALGISLNISSIFFGVEYKF